MKKLVLILSLMALAGCSGASTRPEPVGTVTFTRVEGKEKSAQVNWNIKLNEGAVKLKLGESRTFNIVEK